MKEIESNSSFELTKSEWDGIFSDGSINSSWVHVMANGISKVNCYLALLSNRHWKKKPNSKKVLSALFRADGYCTSSTCSIQVRLSVNSNSFVSNSVRVYASFSGKVNHISGETHAHHISRAQREENCFFVPRENNGTIKTVPQKVDAVVL